ncbi:MAG: alpha/beta hydrolase fold protein [Rhodospirillaceae bacterium]|nr:MAG: alpha/beta hydrolase fold protein [Rhodospirillaceae bacterium]
MTVTLELISHQPERQIFPLPLLFIHGANAGAWVWEEHFLPFFARHGYSAHAMSLRGHGKSSGAAALRWASLADYKADLTQTIQQLGGAAVLIGHSMGATVILKYLQKQRVPAAVLMAPVPVEGVLESSLLLAWRDPGLFWYMSLVQAVGPAAGSYAAMRRALFADSTPDSLIRPYFNHGQAESPRVVMDMMGLDLPRVDRILTTCAAMPFLVCGAEQDALFPRRLVQETAQTLGATTRFFPMGHAMMLEPNWEDAAACIHQWLQTLGLSPMAADNDETDGNVLAKHVENPQTVPEYDSPPDAAPVVPEVPSGGKKIGKRKNKRRKPTPIASDRAGEQPT